MGIFLDENTKVIVQGITGRDGSFHTKQMIEYGTRVVGGVTPGKGGTEANGVPVFNTVKEAVEATGANCSVIFVPAKLAADAILEAAENKVALIICISEGVPIQDMLSVYQFVKKQGVRLIGPNCPGLITPASRGMASTGMRRSRTSGGPSLINRSSTARLGRLTITTRASGKSAAASTESVHAISG